MCNICLFAGSSSHTFDILLYTGLDKLDTPNQRRVIKKHAIPSTKNCIIILKYSKIFRDYQTMIISPSVTTSLILPSTSNFSAVSRAPVLT